MRAIMWRFHSTHTHILHANLLHDIFASKYLLHSVCSPLVYCYSFAVASSHNNTRYSFSLFSLLSFHIEFSTCLLDLCAYLSWWHFSFLVFLKKMCVCVCAQCPCSSIIMTSGCYSKWLCKREKLWFYAENAPVAQCNWHMYFKYNSIRII